LWAGLYSKANLIPEKFRENSHVARGDERTAAARGIPYHETVSKALFLSFFLGF